MATRKAITKSARFEVFKRDKFTCQYCGEKAPQVVLQCDHINPVSAGGDNDLLNLVTSCVACNSGKGSKELSDDTSLLKRKRQLEDLQERREQIEMMLAWKDGLRDLLDIQVDHIDSMIRKSGAGLNKNERDTVSAAVKKFGIETVSDCIEVAMLQYATNIVDMAVRIAQCRAKEKVNPDRARILHIANILNLRCDNLNRSRAVDAMVEARARGIHMAVFEELLTLRGNAIKEALRNLG